MAGGPFAARRARPLTAARSFPPKFFRKTRKREPSESMRRRAAIRSERGQSLAEFALVLPLLVLLLFGIIQFGVTFNHYITLTDAVRAGARTAAVSRHQPDPVAVTTDRVEEAATDLNPADLQVTVESTWEAGDEVVVSASYPYSIKVLGKTIKSGRMNSETTERVE
jgi:Flp pilus assembly protein TadG